MYPGKFDYYVATSVPEAIQLLGQHHDAKLLAGGHSLLPLIKLRLANPAVLIDIGRVPELHGIHQQGNVITIGALTTHNDIEMSALLKSHCPILPEAAALIGDMQVRNRGTIGGSLSHADPAADLPAVMLALGAELVVAGPQGTRTIRADDFFQGLFTTALGADEVLTEVRVPVLEKGSASAYVKYPHPASRYAVVGVAAVGSVAGGNAQNMRVGVTGASDHAYRAAGVEAALNGQPFTAENVAAAAAHAADRMMMLGDLAASDTYRAHLAQVYAGRALNALRERLYR
ncbi:MAG: xanthine dehydrogenase family protein subunit M [Anaerolineae bacterium]